jgi:hypothetical protein
LKERHEETKANEDHHVHILKAWTKEENIIVLLWMHIVTFEVPVWSVS